MSNTLYNLSKDDSQIIKGVAILMIILHNFIHLTSGVSISEMVFDYNNTLSFIVTTANNPLSIVNNLISFLGHYGVQLFIFISAYGLTKKHLKVRIDSYPKYLFERLIKIYVLLIVGLIFFFVFQLRVLPLQEYVDVSLHFLSMIGNFSKDSLFSYIGPWWFFAFIVQLYILFPFIFTFIRRFKLQGAVVLTILSYISIYVLYSLEGVTNFPVFANAIGHLPEFILGICVAMFPNLKVDWKIFVIALAVYIGSCFHVSIFPLGFLAITIVTLLAVKPLLKISKSNYIIRALVFCGRVSMFAFVINGIVRFRTLGWIYTYTDESPIQVFLLAIVHTLIVLAISYVLYLLCSRLSTWIKKRTNISIL